MERFSIRQIIQARKAIQLDDMDADLRNSLWNVIYVYVLFRDRNIEIKNDDKYFSVAAGVWLHYLKRQYDIMPTLSLYYLEQIKQYFFTCKWFEVYDFIEFIIFYTDDETTKKIIVSCNNVLESEVSAYRFVGNQIAPITTKEEISEIDEALKHPLKQVATHIQTALETFSDRKTPDYRNSIKESISAIEAICRLITGDPAATLGKALDEIKKSGKVKLHKLLIDAFDKLYLYTCDDGGIRHALKDDLGPDAEDAKFMLVACSAFVNYLTVKATKAGIKFKETA